MEINIIIIIIEDPEEEERELVINVSHRKDKYLYTLYFSGEEKYNAFLKRKTLYLTDFENDIDNGIDYLRNNIVTFSNLVNNTMPTYIIFDINDIKKIDNVILDISNLSWNDKLYIINNIANSNTYFRDTYSYTINEILSLEEIQKIYNKINSIANKLINKSPLEQLYSIYNMLKQRPYICENPNESPSVSRTLINCLFNEKIVCTGFCNIFKAICDSLGINTTYIRWKNNKGHVSIMCFVNDSKYNIIGIYVIDVTWDSLRNERITHFLTPLAYEELEKKKKGFELIKRNNIYYSLLDSSVESNNELIDIINSIYRLLKIDRIIDETYNIAEEITNIINYTKVYIDPFTLREIINSEQVLDDDTCLELIQTSYHYKTILKEDKTFIRLRQHVDAI